MPLKFKIYAPSLLNARICLNIGIWDKGQHIKSGKNCPYKAKKSVEINSGSKYCPLIENVIPEAHAIQI